MPDLAVFAVFAVIVAVGVWTERKTRPEPTEAEELEE